MPDDTRLQQHAQAETLPESGLMINAREMAVFETGRKSRHSGSNTQLRRIRCRHASVARHQHSSGQILLALGANAPVACRSVANRVDNSSPSVTLPKSLWLLNTGLCFPDE